MLARTATAAALLCGVSLGLSGCSGRSAPPSSAAAARSTPSAQDAGAATAPTPRADDGWCPRRAPGDPGPPVSYARVVRWSQRVYLGSARRVPAERRGAFVGQVRCDLSTSALPVNQRLRDGDATFPAGTKLYELAGMPLARALLVQLGDGYFVFDVIDRKG